MCWFSNRVGGWSSGRYGCGLGKSNGNGNGKSNGNGNGKGNGNGNGKDKSIMRGFFASLRMTREKGGNSYGTGELCPLI
jgi:hypothetical protein